MIKLNGKILASDKEYLNKQWDAFMKDIDNGVIDREKAIYLMERLNCIDKFLISQGIKP